MDKLKLMEHKVEVMDGMKKLFIEILVEVISGVISKLISGGASGPQPDPA